MVNCKASTEKHECQIVQQAIIIKVSFINKTELALTSLIQRLN